MKQLIDKLFNTKVSTSYMFILFGVSALMLAGYFSYAWFTVQGVQQYSVVTGTLNGTVAIGTNSVAINGQGVITYTPSTDNDTITLTVTNTNDRTVKNSIYYYNLSDSNITIGYTSDSSTVPSTQGVSVAQGKTLTYKIKIRGANGRQIKIGSSMGLNNSNLTLPSGTTAFSLLKDPTGAEVLVAKANPEDLDYYTASTEQKNEMWTFSHDATEQLGATNDYRYIGPNPDNYVKFNDGLWRIIGVFDTDDGTGKIEKRMKIIKNGYIYNTPWNSNNVNEWSTSSLKITLNTGEFYTSLTDTAKEMIGDSKWYLGGSSSYDDVTTAMFYTKERGTNVYSGRSINWTGKVGLIYPSDYGYATIGGSGDCMRVALYNWNNNVYNYCYNNDWLLEPSFTYWTMSQRSDRSDYVFLVGNIGIVGFNNASRGDIVARPVVYLKSTINITSGTGSSTDPFILAQS